MQGARRANGQGVLALLGLLLALALPRAAALASREPNRNTAKRRPSPRRKKTARSPENSMAPTQKSRRQKTTTEGVVFQSPGLHPGSPDPEGTRAAPQDSPAQR